MFDGLSRSLEKAWDSVRKDGKLTADNIKTPMREIRRALLEADVSAAAAMQDGLYCIACNAPHMQEALCRAGLAMCRGVPDHAWNTQLWLAVLCAAVCVPGCCRPQQVDTALAAPSAHKSAVRNALSRPTCTARVASCWTV